MHFPAHYYIPLPKTQMLAQDPDYVITPSRRNDPVSPAPLMFAVGGRFGLAKSKSSKQQLQQFYPKPGRKEQEPSTTRSADNHLTDNKVGNSYKSATNNWKEKREPGKTCALQGPSCFLTFVGAACLQAGEDSSRAEPPLTLGWQFRSRSPEGSIFSPHHHMKEVHVSVLVLFVLISSPVKRSGTTAAGRGLLKRETLTPLSLAHKLILHHCFHFWCCKRTARLRHDLCHRVLSHCFLQKHRRKYKFPPPLLKSLSCNGRIITILRLLVQTVKKIQIWVH